MDINKDLARLVVLALAFAMSPASESAVLSCIVTKYKDVDKSKIIADDVAKEMQIGKLSQFDTSSNGWRTTETAYIWSFSVPNYTKPIDAIYVNRETGEYAYHNIAAGADEKGNLIFFDSYYIEIGTCKLKEVKNKL